VSMQNIVRLGVRGRSGIERDNEKLLRSGPLTINILTCVGQL
jgi:hypothetical protein